MAPRLFPRNPKKPPDATAPPDADTDSQLFSKDLAFGHVPVGETKSDQVTPQQASEVESQDRQEPGWYPDDTDPGLMRYWDGFHFTGQAKRSSSEAPSDAAPLTTAGPPTSTATPTGTATPPTTEVEITDVDAVVESLLGPSVGELQSIGELQSVGESQRVGESQTVGDQAPPRHYANYVGPQIPPWTGPTQYFQVGITESPTPQESDVVVGSEATPMNAVPSVLGQKEVSETIETHVVASADDDSVTIDDGHRGNEMSDSSHSENVGDGVSNWGKDAEQAVSRALTVDTPEAWQAAADVAAVVSEMAQTMQSVADAKQTARQTAKEAEEAAESSRVAAETASEATKTAERMAKAADDAAEAARVAARTAVEAKEAAERTAQAAPKAAEAAEAASQTAADARQKSEALELVVASARAANTPSAWSDARQLAAVAAETKQSVTETPSIAPEPVNTPSPSLWKRSAPIAGSIAEPVDQTVKTPGSIEATEPGSQDVDVLAELGPAPFLTPAPDGGRSGSQID